MLSKKNRISNRQLIAKLLAKGKVYQCNYFTVKYLPSDKPGSQFAVTVSKKVSNKAVERNKARRQINEAIRPNLESISSDIVAVIIAKQSILKSNYQELTEEIAKFLNQIESDAK